MLPIDRPYWAFFFINLSAWSLALGPATFMGIARLRDHRLWLIVGAGIAAAALADLSGLSLGEVERIWLLFYPWLTLATFAFVGLRVGGRRVHLAFQAGTAIVIQFLFLGPW